MAKPAVVRAAWITLGGAIVAAIIAGSFQVFGPSRSPQTITAPDATNSPITMLSGTRDVTIQYNLPDTTIRDAVKALEQKAEDHAASIQLNRDELLLLSKALQDLDQRTSGMRKLPDGRTGFGHFVSGEPVIVIQEQNTAAARFNAQDYKAAFEHSQRAIKAYEDTKQFSEFRSGDLKPEMVGKLYMLGVMIAQKFENKQLAHEYALKAVEAHPSPLHQALLATTSSTSVNLMRR